MFYGMNAAEIDCMTTTLRRKMYFGFYTKHIVNTVNLSLATEWILPEAMTQLRQLEKAEMPLGIKICYNCFANIDAISISISFKLSEIFFHVLTFFKHKSHSF